MNKVELLGRLTKEPEVRYTTKNAPVSNFTLAVDRKVKKESEVTADFFNIKAFGTLADVCNKYLHKGTQIVIIGRIQNRNWDDDQGQKHYVTEIIAEEMFFAGSNKTNDKEIEAENEYPVNSDDLPF